MNCPLRRFARLSAGILLLLAGACLAGGCGPPPTGNVSGKVSLKDGRPLPGGTVMFFPTEGGKGNPVSAVVQEDGSYEAVAVPVGQARIIVNNLALKPNANSIPIALGGKIPMKVDVDGKMVAGGPPKDALKDVSFAPVERPAQPGTYVPLDPKYANAEESGLSFTVQPGPQTWNIEGLVALDKKR